MMIAECQSYASDNLLIDGFPRTMIQAEDVQKQLPVSCVLCLDVPFEEIINRISGRYTHVPSGRTYNDNFNPPKRKGFDDVTGEPLTRRDDDDLITVRKRLDVYQLSTLPLLDYYGCYFIEPIPEGTQLDCQKCYQTGLKLNQFFNADDQ
ncbi:unnamed protein product [Schistosoma mattheei]|uniref:Adenylate kinase active site lid domain-containing protein n=1 Tax=Schistosoma mattheei TaxID=31246 RepID=A0AA85B4B2_9TREM|nr:unnamed protein product [Schistosoma mattheei]